MTWSIKSHPDDATKDQKALVTIDEKTGKVTVKADALTGDYVITATSNSDANVTDTFTVTVTS